MINIFQIKFSISLVQIINIGKFLIFSKIDF
jgi:hypothetical protein